MKYILLAIVGGIMLLLGMSALQAQDASASASTIDVESLASATLLSPDDHTLAVYNHYAIYNTAPTADLVAIRLIDAQTGETIGSLSGFSDWVTGLAFNSDGSRLVSFHGNGDLILWDVAAKKMLKTIPTFALGGGWVQFLGEDKTVLYRAGEFVVGLLDMETGAITHLFGQHIDSYDQFSTQYSQYPGRGDITFAGAEASPDGHWLATSTQNDEVILWDVNTGEQWTLREASKQFGQFSIRAFVFSKDGSQLTYFDNSDKKTHVWDVVKRSEISTFDFGGASFALSADGKQIAWADRATQSIYTADMTPSATPVKLIELPEALQVAPNVTSLAFTSDDKQLVVGGLFAEDGKNKIYIVQLES